MAKKDVAKEHHHKRKPPHFAQERSLIGFVPARPAWISRINRLGGDVLATAGIH
jgi:hypothetical protein